MGGRRGRLISLPDRELAIELIEEANSSGASIGKICKEMEISISTFERWRSGKLTDARRGAEKKIPRKMSPEEEQLILDKCNNHKFMNDNPYKIHASLLDKGLYIGSISTFYRTLKKNKLINHRANTKPRQGHNPPPERVATGPNQVWCWDITWLPSIIRGIFHYGDMIKSCG